MIDKKGEVKEVQPQDIPLFKDWSLYEAAKVTPQLPINIRYTPPKPNDDLRRKIKPIENTLNINDKFCLRSCLSFLEGGLLEDDFGRDERARDQFVNSHTIVIDGRRITFDVLAKEVNRLSGVAVLRIVTAGQLVGNRDLETKAIELMKKVEIIKRERGFFQATDLGQVDDLALSIIEYILHK